MCVDCIEQYIIVIYLHVSYTKESKKCLTIIAVCLSISQSAGNDRGHAFFAFNG